MSAEFNGKKLKSIRKAKRITQEALAEKAALGDRYIRELESGRKSNPSVVLVYRMANTLDVSVEDLMEITPDETTL